MYNLGYYIRFLPSAVTWEQEPENFRVWWRQRTRWARGNEYVIFKYLWQIHKLRNKKIVIDLYYFFFTYFLFFGGVILSHFIFIVNLIHDLELSIGNVSYALLITGFLLFVTEVCLALCIEPKQLTMKNFLIVIFMYFTYSQLWIFLTVHASWLEVKRIILRQEITWYKTQRFKQPVRRNPS